MFYYLLGAISSIIILSYKNNILYNSLLYYENIVDKYKGNKNNIYIEIIQNNKIKKYYDLTQLNTDTIKNDTLILNWYINNNLNKMIINTKNTSNIIMASIIVITNNKVIEHEITKILNSFIIPNISIKLNDTNKHVWVSLLNNKFNTNYNTNTDFTYNIILQDVSIHKSNQLIINTDSYGYVKINDK